MKNFYLVQKREKHNPASAAEMRLNGVDPDGWKFCEAYTDEAVGEAMETVEMLKRIHAQICAQYESKQTCFYRMEKIEVDPDTTLADVRYNESAA